MDSNFKNLKFSNISKIAVFFTISDFEEGKNTDIENELSDISQKNTKNMPAGGLRQLMFCSGP